MTPIWSSRLVRAAAALADDTTPHKFGDLCAALDADVRSRAHEYTRIAVATAFSRAQIEYTHCLLQRLDLDWDSPRDTHVEFRAAWDEAMIDAAADRFGRPDAM